MKNIEIDEKMIVLQVTVNNRNFAITVDKKIFEIDENGKIHKCSRWDKDAKAIKLYLKPLKSLDII